MSAYTGPDGERVAIFGEGGGELLADELDVPLLAKVPLSSELREHADDGKPLVIEDPDAPASQMIREAARGIVAATPVELPVMQDAQATPAAAPNGGGISGTELPMVQ
jgi:ATP-binding protein involved in chromosome partitioning